MSSYRVTLVFHSNINMVVTELRGYYIGRCGRFLVLTEF